VGSIPAWRIKVYKFFLKTYIFQYCLTVRISGFHPGSPGSTPGIGKRVRMVSKTTLHFLQKVRKTWPYRPAVRTWDFDSVAKQRSNPETRVRFSVRPRLFRKKSAKSEDVRVVIEP
jgi:hypothetical protein